jgi:hypothetical protein
MDFFDLLENRAAGRLPANPPEEFYSPDSARDIDPQHYLVLGGNDISRGNLGLVLTPGAASAPSDEKNQDTDQKKESYDPGISYPNMVSDERRTGVDTMIFNPFGGTAGEAIDAAAAQAQAEDLARQIGAGAADTATETFTGMDIALVDPNQPSKPAQQYNDNAVYPPVKSPGNPLYNIWFLGALGLAAFFIFGGKK